MEEIAELMVGRKLERDHLPPRTTPTMKILSLELADLSVEMPGERVQGLNLKYGG